MPEETRYLTMNGNVPNGGIVPSRMFASVAGLPFGLNPGSNPFRGCYGPPPPYAGPQYDRNSGGYAPYFPTMHPGPPPPALPAPRAAAPSAPTPAPYEPPGQYLDGHILRGDGWTYITPVENTMIRFVGDGTRPCDAPNGYYPHQFAFTAHKVPSMMTVKDLIKGLGAPAGDQNGITEMVELGDNRFASGVTIMQGSDDAKKTLAEVGWTQRNSEAAAIWFVVKR